MGGNPLRTYVIGERRRASSMRPGCSGNPGHGVGPLIGPGELIGDVGDPEKIDHGGDLGGGPQASRGGVIAVISARCPPAEPPVATILLAIHFVLGGVVLEPLRRFENIVHRGGRRRRLCQPILDVRHHHASAHERQAKFFEHVLLGAFHPAAAVNDDHAGPVGERRRAGLQNIEDGLRVMVVTNVGLDLVIGSGSAGTKGEQ